jgi:CRP-like cAMP-binding protein
MAIALLRGCRGPAAVNQRRGRAGMNDIAGILASVDIFRGLDQEKLVEVAARCRRANYVKGQEIICYQDTTKDVYFIKSGRVGISILSHGGKEIGFRHLAEGQMFGDLAAIDGDSRSASAVSLSAVELVRISDRDFHRVLIRFPEVNLRELQRLTTLIRSLSERIYEFTTLGVHHRIHAELLRLAKTHMTGPTVANIYPAPTHADIANQVSTHREAVSREFSRLNGEGLIERRGRNLIVHDVPRLEQMINAVEA